MISNHYVKMPAVLAALAAPGIAGVYYVDLDAVTGSAQIKFHVDLDAIDATPARWRAPDTLVDSTQVSTSRATWT